MHVSRKSYLLGALLTASILLLAIIVSPNRSTALFGKFIANPIPDSLQVVQADYVSGREWRAYFHVRLLPKDFSLVLAAKQFERLQPNSPSYEAFIETTYRLFRARLPTAPELKLYEIYESWNDVDGTVTYVIASPEHNELFAVSVRF